MTSNDGSRASSSPLVELHRVLEHTRLSADTTPADIDRLCDEALVHRFVGVCVAPMYVARAAARLRGAETRVVTVVGFPLGAATSRMKAFEAEQAARDGAEEIDMVMAVGLALASEWDGVERDVRAVRVAVPGAVLKVILETGYLPPDSIRTAAIRCADAGADFVKTSTGFGPRGASVEDIVLLRDTVGGRVRIKASGGIRTREDAVRLMKAGAVRIGTSSAVQMMLDK
jgi:deoxyribose-phosphate aldolase